LSIASSAETPGFGISEDQRERLLHRTHAGSLKQIRNLKRLVLGMITKTKRRGMVSPDQIFAEARGSSKLVIGGRRLPARGFHRFHKLCLKEKTKILAQGEKKMQKKIKFRGEKAT